MSYFYQWPFTPAGGGGPTTYEASGTIAAVSGQAGTVTARFVASGAITVVSTLVGDATRVPLVFAASGTITVTSTLVGNAQVRAVASGTIPVVSGQAGTVTARYVASGTIIVVTTLAGDPTVYTPIKVASGTIPVVSGQSGAVTVRMVASGTIPVVSGQQGTVTARYAVSGAVVVVSTLVGDPTRVPVTFTVGGTVTLVLAVSGDPTTIVAPVIMLRLVLNRGRDEGGIPPEPWNHFSYPFTQTALLLFTDGRVIPTFTLEGPLYYSADAVAAGGHDSIYPSDAWEAEVLAAAGYDLEPVL